MPALDIYGTSNWIHRESQWQYKGTPNASVFALYSILVPFAAKLELILDAEYDSELENRNSTHFQALASTVQEEVIH